MEHGHRLITRNDFDGLACAVLLRSLGLIEQIDFVHPKEMQDGRVAVTDRDITANLPYAPGVHLAFDHHASEAIRVGSPPPQLILDPDKPSAARVIYEHYGGAKAFPKVPVAMMAAVDEADAAGYTEFEQIFEPTGWNLLNYILDPRTGLSRLRFRTDQETMVRDLADKCLTMSIDDILELPDVKERVERYFEEEEKGRAQIKRNATIQGNLVVIDLRSEAEIHPVNRFVVYTIFPDQNISLSVLRADSPDTVMLAVGRSILNPTSKTHVGELMLRYGGGGHAGAGTCQVASGRADDVMRELVERITADG